VHRRRAGNRRHFRAALAFAPARGLSKSATRFFSSPPLPQPLKGFLLPFKRLIDFRAICQDFDNRALDGFAALRHHPLNIALQHNCFSPSFLCSTSIRSPTLITVSEQLIANNKVQLDNFLNAAGIAFSGAERLIDLQTQASKAVFADFAQHLKSLSEVKDVQAWTDLQARASQPAADRFAGYTRNLYAVCSETGGNLSKLLETQFTEFNKSCSTALDQAAKNAPAGSETTLAVAKSAMAAANQAFDAISKASKQIVEVADVAVGSTAKKKAA
jgi:phasin family protein